MLRDRNLGPCWHGKIPTEKLPPCTLYRTQQGPKGSAITSILHPQHWLRSDEIDFASHLLAREYNGIDGLQASFLFSVLGRGGIVGTPTMPFVQILHTGGNHWVTASNLFAGNNEICIYDSLSTMLDNNTEQALSWMLRPNLWSCFLLFSNKPIAATVACLQLDLHMHSAATLDLRTVP